MTIRPITFETPTGHREASWGVYDDDGRLLAPCGSREVAQRWRKCHEKEESCNAGTDVACAGGGYPLGGVRGIE